MKKLASTPSRICVSGPEAASALGLGPDAFNEHVAPHLPVLRIGRRRLFAVADLEAWVRASTERPLSEQVGA